MVGSEDDVISVANATKVDTAGYIFCCICIVMPCEAVAQGRECCVRSGTFAHGSDGVEEVGRVEGVAPK